MERASLLRILTAGVFLALMAACGGGGGGTSVVPGTFTKRYPAGAGDNWTGLLSRVSTYAHWQFLYRPGDIQASGRITALALEYHGAMATAVSCPGITIKMGHSGVNTLGATFADNVQNGRGSLITVLEGVTLNFPAGADGDLATIKLASPFEYNGVDSLVIDFERSGECSGDVHDRDANGLTYNGLVYTFTNGLGSGTTLGLVSYLTFVFEGGEKVTAAADRTGNDSNTIAPASTGRTQYLLLASDIKGSGPVTGIHFQLPSLLLDPLAGSYKITLSHVAPATVELGDTFADNVGSNATVVADGVALNIPVGTTSFWVPMTNRFDYDGTSNLLVDVEATVTAGAAAVSYQNVGVYRTVAAPAVTAAAGTRYQRGLEPRLRFLGAPLTTALQPPGWSSNVLGAGHPAQIQSLYRNDRLGTGGRIEAVHVRLHPSESSPAAATLTNYRLYMGHTSKHGFVITDTYASNMDENALVMSGALEVPAGIRAGDWVKIPLTTPFNYDARRNLTILFATDAGTAGNVVSASWDTDRFPEHSVVRNDNSATTSDTPTLPWDGIIDVKLEMAN